MGIIIRKAKSEECSVLTDISFAAKHVWNYPEKYFETWKEELTITEEYIQRNTVRVAEMEGTILGYYSIVENKQDFWAGKVFVMAGHWLEHIFIRPDCIGKGIGTRLIKDIQKNCRNLGVKKIYIFSDPHANGFYHKMRADYVKESLSSIEGRTVSLFEMIIEPVGGKALENFEYQEMTIEDYDQAYQLWWEIEGIGLSEADSRDNIQKFLQRNQGLCFVCKDGETLAGTVLAGHDGRRGHIYHLAVAPKFRMRGIAKRLMDRCFKQLRKEGITKCHLFVFSDNEPGKNFWIRNGWTKREDITVFSKDSK
jgi:ribosomal protein S18 acetylase RimI-like enzyme